MTGRLTPITSRHADRVPASLQCKHPITRELYDPAREDDGAYSCPACRRDWAAAMLKSSRFGAGLRALMPESAQGALL